VGGREQGHGHRLLVRLVVPHPQEELSRGLGVEGGGDDGEGCAGSHPVPAHHLLVIPAIQSLYFKNKIRGHEEYIFNYGAEQEQKFSQLSFSSEAVTKS
jgi:hypothetical protein